MIKPRRTEVFLSRPISVAGWKPRKQTTSGQIVEKRFRPDRHQRVTRNMKVDRRINADRRLENGGILTFFVTKRGRGSRDLADMRPGEEAELIGPLGNSWPLADVNAEKPADLIALIGGGAGIAPLLALSPELGKRPFDFYAGFRSGSFGLENISPKALIIATEDGSQGVKGRILDFFAPSGYNMIFACGPEPMLKHISGACIARGIPCFISMASRMACGVGACLGCKIKTTRGNLCCCKDGPIFNAEEICFEN
jgi:NAD(P)H-flavin reductase